MIPAFVSVVALFVLGWFPAALVTRSVAWATITAPLATGVLAAVWIPPMILVRAPFAAAVSGVVLTSVACGVWVVRNRSTMLERPQAGWAWLLLLPAAAITPLLTLRLPPVGWDARSIWWFHARWYLEGGAATGDALRNQAFAFSHPDYPPLASGATAVEWWFGGSATLRAAQAGSALLTLSAVLTLGAVVWRMVGPRLPVVGAGLGALVVLGAYGVTGEGISAPAAGTNGYVDLLQGAALVAAALLLLVAPVDDRAAVCTGALCLAVAAATKNEGIVDAAIVAAVVFVRVARNREVRRRTATWVVGAFVPVLLWLGVVVGSDVTSESDRSNVDELLQLDSRITRRFDPTLDALWDQMWPLLIAAVFVTVVGIVVFRGVTRPEGRSTGSVLWIVWGGTTVALLGAYLISALPIGFHLVTSVDRTTITPKLALVGVVVSWAVLGIATISPVGGQAEATSAKPAASPT